MSGCFHYQARISPDRLILTPRNATPNVHAPHALKRARPMNVNTKPIALHPIPLSIPSSHYGVTPILHVQRMGADTGLLGEWSQNPLPTCHPMSQGLNYRQKQFRPAVRLSVPPVIIVYFHTHRRGLNLPHSSFRLSPRSPLSYSQVSRLSPMLCYHPWTLDGSSFLMQLWGI